MAQVIDVLHELRNVLIQSDKPYGDGYGPGKLLESIDSTGFRAERFVGPPVNLTIKFPCSFRLHSVHFNNALGSFVSSGFEVLAYGVPDNKSPDDNPVFQLIGKCQRLNPGVVVFVNQRFGGQLLQTDEDFSGKQKFRLSSRYRGLLNQTRYLIIRITHTSGGKIPVISNLAIYGIPSSKIHLKNNLAQIGNSRMRQMSPARQDYAVSDNKNSDNKHQGTRTLHELVDETLTIPKDFIDPITCEMMTMPIVLPSGYTVDQATLDRHVDTEKSWGRKPSDPYTGIELTEKNRPVLNEKLKERLDRYAIMAGLPVAKFCGVKRKLSSTEPSEGGQTSFKISATSAGRIHCNRDNTEKPIEIRGLTNAPRLSERLGRILNKTSGLRTLCLAEKKENSCSICKNSTNNRDVVLYVLECHHYVCRNCAVAGNSVVVCGDCASETATSKISRAHCSA